MKNKPKWQVFWSTVRDVNDVKVKYNLSLVCQEKVIKHFHIPHILHKGSESWLRKIQPPTIPTKIYVAISSSIAIIFYGDFN